MLAVVIFDFASGGGPLSSSSTIHHAMNRILTLAFSLLLIVVTGAEGADKTKSSELPSYPHQRTINVALRQLTEAQELIKGGKGIADAIACLKKAEDVLSKDKGNDHGSFKETAHRLSGQAAKSLEKSLTDKAAHEIEEAIEAAHKAAKAKAN